MRRLALVIVGGAVWLLLAVPAFADNGPHHAGAGATPDSCAGCHRAHTAQAENLLKDASQTGLCLTCHGNGGGGATTNVQGGQQFQATDATVPGAVTSVTRGTTVAGPLRGGGFDTAAIGSDTVTPGFPGTGTVGVLGTPITTTSKHDVDGVARTAWGSGDISAVANTGTSVSLTCGSCHDPHGNTQYRILKPTPTGAYVGTYTGITPNVAAMGNILIADATAYTYTTANYWAPADANATDYKAKVSSWCSSCHTRYLAASGSAGTSSGDAVFNYRHRTISTSGSTACISCHVSHGSNAAMGTNSQAVPLPGATVGRGADSSLLRVDNRGVCQQCHEK